MYIHDYHIFWSALQSDKSIAGEHQVSNGLLGLIDNSILKYIESKWLDLGTYEQYQTAVSETEEYNFGKTNEFLYCTESKVIKFFDDKAITAARVRKAAIKPQVFPQISATANQWYGYEFVPGKTLYAENSPKLFDNLLIWLNEELWTPAHNVSSQQMFDLCKKFYQDKL